MKKEKYLANLLFWLTLVSPIISFALLCEIGEVEIFDIAGIARYSWIMWLFIPVGILSLFIGGKLKGEGEKYKKNYVIAFICLPFLIICGSYRFIFTEFSYEGESVPRIEKIVDVEIPNNIKIATEQRTDHSISYLKIIDKNSNDEFKNCVKGNSLWKEELASNIKGILPIYIQNELVVFDYFVFYNITSEEYNTFPLKGNYDCVFVAYDYDMQRLVIFDNYELTIV